MLATNLLVVFLMVLSLLGTVVSPEYFVLPAYSTLFFPIIIFFNAAFVLIWLLARKWYFLISLVVILLATPQVGDTIPLHFKRNKIEVSGHPISILSYNTMMSGGLQKHTENQKNPVLQYILDSDADIVCLQEFAVSRKKEYLTDEDVRRIFRKYPYKHIWYNLNLSWARAGVATFSRYPIVKRYNIPASSKYMSSIYSDIVVGGDTLRLFNNHLESNRLTESDRKMPVDLSDNFNTKSLSGTTLHLSKKLGEAYIARAKQADSIAYEREKSPYPVLICGDFNDVPVSYTYSKIKGNLKDAFSETGVGLGWTMNLPLYKFRIDYVLHDKTFAVADFYVSKVDYSDHYPVRCKLYFDKNYIEDNN